MDFLDTPNFASVNSAEFSEFLGLGNKKQKATAQNQWEADIQNRYPFSDNCEGMKKMIAAMYQESASTLQQRNSAKKNSKTRNDLTGKLRAFDAYIPAAVAYMNSTSCSASNAVNNASSAGIGTKAGSTNLSSLSTSVAGLTGSSNPNLKYVWIGLGIAVLAGTAVYIIKNKNS